MKKCSMPKGGHQHLKHLNHYSTWLSVLSFFNLEKNSCVYVHVL